MIATRNARKLDLHEDAYLKLQLEVASNRRRFLAETDVHADCGGKAKEPFYAGRRGDLRNRVMDS
jgi:hypothetical protein